MISLWLSLLIGMSVPAICLVFYWLFKGQSKEHRRLVEAAFILGAFGLIVQTSRSIYYFSHGHYPVDIGVPLWMTKDIAICLFVAHFARSKDEQG